MFLNAVGMTLWKKKMQCPRHFSKGTGCFSAIMPTLWVFKKCVPFLMILTKYTPAFTNGARVFVII